MDSSRLSHRQKKNFKKHTKKFPPPSPNSAPGASKSAAESSYLAKMEEFVGQITVKQVRKPRAATPIPGTHRCIRATEQHVTHLSKTIVSQNESSIMIKFHGDDESGHVDAEIISQCSKEFIRHEAENQKMKKKVDELELKMTNREKDVQGFRTQLEDLYRDSSAWKQEKEELEQKIDDMQEAFAEQAHLAVHNDQLQKRIEVLEKDIKLTKKTDQDLLQSLLEMSKNNKNLSNENKKLKEEVQQLKNIECRFILPSSSIPPAIQAPATMLLIFAELQRKNETGRLLNEKKKMLTKLISMTTKSEIKEQAAHEMYKYEEAYVVHRQDLQYNIDKIVSTGQISNRNISNLFKISDNLLAEYHSEIEKHSTDTAKPPVTPLECPKCSQSLPEFFCFEKEPPHEYPEDLYQ